MSASRLGAQPAERREERLILGPDRRLQSLAQPLRERRAAAPGGDRDGEVPPPHHRRDQKRTCIRRVGHVHQTACAPYRIRHRPVHLRVVGGCEHQEGIREVGGSHGSAAQTDRAGGGEFCDLGCGGRADHLHLGAAVHKTRDLALGDPPAAHDQTATPGQVHHHRIVRRHGERRSPEPQPVAGGAPRAIASRRQGGASPWCA